MVSLNKPDGFKKEKPNGLANGKQTESKTKEAQAQNANKYRNLTTRLGSGFEWRCERKFTTSHCVVCVATADHDYVTLLG